MGEARYRRDKGWLALPRLSLHPCGPTCSAKESTLGRNASRGGVILHRRKVAGVDR